MNIEIISPAIFDKSRICAGITLKNIHMFPHTGFTISKSNDENADLINNHRRILANNLSVSIDRLKFQKQIHGSFIRIVDMDSSETESDGLLTSEGGIYLCISVADCCAILMHDIKRNVLAALHSGWRGAKHNIVKNGIEFLSKSYSSEPGDLKVWLSPCASEKSYIVGEDVARYFPDAVEYVKKDFPKLKIGNDNYESGNENKYFLDLKKIIKTQLVDVGVRTQNIEVSNECTITDIRFHSFRRDGARSGRMAAFIGMI